MKTLIAGTQNTFFNTNPDECEHKNGITWYNCCKDCGKLLETDKEKEGYIEDIYDSWKDESK